MNEGFVRNKIESLPVSDGIALDIGANHGMYTSLLAQKFKKVYAFEPHPDNFKIIQERVTDKNVEFVNKAVGIVDGKLHLFTCGNPGGHSISNAVADAKRWGHNKENYVEVDSVMLDTFCKDKKIDFIKCDIEGAENFIFNYGIETLKNNKIEMILEVHQTVDCEKLWSFFNGLGYTSYAPTNKVTGSYINDEHYFITNK